MSTTTEEFEPAAASGGSGGAADGGEDRAARDFRVKVWVELIRLHCLRLPLDSSSDGSRSSGSRAIDELCAYVSASEAETLSRQQTVQHFMDSGAAGASDLDDLELDEAEEAKLHHIVGTVHTV